MIEEPDDSDPAIDPGPPAGSENEYWPFKTVILTLIVGMIFLMPLVKVAVFIVDFITGE